MLLTCASLPAPKPFCFVAWTLHALGAKQVNDFVGPLLGAYHKVCRYLWMNPAPLSITALGMFTFFCLGALKLIVSLSIPMQSRDVLPYSPALSLCGVRFFRPPFSPQLTLTSSVCVCV